MRYALKFAYDGSAFDGYARQPGMKTVEGETIRVMESLGIIDDVKANNFQSASRTDRGVSAAGNVIAINADFNADALVPALNSKLDGACFWALAAVNDDFNARYARQRWYRYVLPGNRCPGIDMMRSAAAAFVGERDFREYSKKDSGDEDTILTLESIEMTEEGEFVIIDFRAQHFLWQMVRRLVSAMLADGTRRGGVGPAPAENLVLMDVVYDFKFKTVADKSSSFSSKKSEAELRAKVMGQII